MSQETQTPAVEEAQRPTFEAGSEDEAVNALMERNAEAKQSPETPEDEPAAEVTEEAEQADPEETIAAELLEEAEYEGKTYKVAPEIAKALLRQSDYSRKMNEVGEKEKAYTQRLEVIEGLEQVAERRAEALAEVRAIDKQIKGYEGIDWAKAKAERPSEAAMAAVELLSLRDQRRDAVNAAAQIAREMTEGRKKLAVGQAADMAKVLDKELPGWRGDVGVRITAYAVESGWKPEELGAVTDPRVVLALDKASKYDALQKSKADLKAKPLVPPVSKPGARRPQASPANDAMARFRQTTSDEDAIAALVARRK